MDSLQIAILMDQVKAELKAELKSELKAELLAELKAELAPPPTKPEQQQPALNFQVKTNKEFSKLQNNKEAFALFAKWCATQKNFRHQMHAFNWLFKHHGQVTIKRNTQGEFVIAGKQSWQL